MYRGEFDLVSTYIEQSLQLYDPEYKDAIRGRAIVDPKAEALCILVQQLWLCGLTDQARQLGEEAVTHARALRHPDGLVFALTLADLFLAVVSGDARATLALADEILVLTDEVRAPFFQAFGGVGRGWALAKLGQKAEGQLLLLESIENWREAGCRTYLTPFLSWLAELYLDGDQADRAVELIDEALGLTEETGERFFEAELHRLRAVALLVESPAANELAHASFRKALDVAHAQGAKSLELRAAVSFAKCLVRADERARALALLEPVYGSFTEGLETAELLNAAALMEELRSTNNEGG